MERTETDAMEGMGAIVRWESSIVPVCLGAIQNGLKGLDHVAALIKENIHTCCFPGFGIFAGPQRNQHRTRSAIL